MKCRRFWCLSKKKLTIFLRIKKKLKKHITNEKPEFRRTDQFNKIKSHINFECKSRFDPITILHI